MGNPDIHWEVVRKFNFGIDYSFFGGLLAGNVEIFRDRRTDVLLQGANRATPSFFGGITQAPWAHLGTIDNKGYELELRINKTLRNGLHLWGNFNMTHAISEVVDGDDAAELHRDILHAEDVLTHLLCPPQLRSFLPFSLACQTDPAARARP